MQVYEQSTEIIQYIIRVVRDIQKSDLSPKNNLTVKKYNFKMTSLLGLTTFRHFAKIPRTKLGEYHENRFHIHFFGN